MLAVNIVVGGDSQGGKMFSEEAVTSVVNAHGALISLAQKVVVGQTITVLNVKSKTELLAEIVDVGDPRGGKAEVGIEFLEPAPRFWRVAFPPDDWSPRSPEAKQRTVSPPISTLKPHLPK
jgi:hypothetical protein